MQIIIINGPNLNLLKRLLIYICIRRKNTFIKLLSIRKIYIKQYANNYNKRS